MGAKRIIPGFVGAYMICGFVGGVIAGSITISMGIFLQSDETGLVSKLITSLFLSVIAGPIGGICGFILGLPLGLLNGTLTTLFFNPPRYRILYHAMVGVVSIILAYVGSDVLFGKIFPYSEGSFTNPAAGIAALTAGISSQLIAVWYFARASREASENLFAQDLSRYLTRGFGLGFILGGLVGLPLTLLLGYGGSVLAPAEFGQNVNTFETLRGLALTVEIFMGIPAMGGATLGSLVGSAYALVQRRG